LEEPGRTKENQEEPGTRENQGEPGRTRKNQENEEAIRVIHSIITKMSNLSEFAWSDIHFAQNPNLNPNSQFPTLSLSKV